MKVLTMASQVDKSQESILLVASLCCQRGCGVVCQGRQDVYDVFEETGSGSHTLF